MKNAAKDDVSFHMPGHKGRSALYEEAGYGALLKNAAAWDIRWIITQSCMAPAIRSCW